MPRPRTNDEENELKRLRERKGLTQEQAAERVGVARTLWSQWELKGRPMTVEQLNRIQRALKLSNEQTEKIRRWWGTPHAEEAA